MSGFRKPYTVLREVAGGYVNGLFVAGARSVASVLMSAQPITDGRERDMVPLPEGRHLSDTMKFYTSERLFVTADGEGIQPDIVVVEGYGYELLAISIHQSGVINHYKFVGIKVFKFTTNADWIAGTLKRP
jgi:hypothetical protein